ncbi:MAG: MBL fold metallo-hydrolase [Myxococcales bacterium]|nr:MBL fold metallo-hydrolase [Myxococcales bacterium]
MSAPRVQVLGIAQDGGHPQTGCLRPCCVPARATGLRHLVSCLGVVDGERRFMLDCTPDFPTQLHLLGAPPLDGILLTHAHMGHYTGLLQLGPEAWAPRDVPVHVMPGMEAFLSANEPWASLAADGHAVWSPLRAGEPVPLTERLSVVPRLVPHRGPWSETVALELRGPSRRALYLPDLDRWGTAEEGADPVVLLESVDRAWVDGTFFDLGEIPWRDPAAVIHPLVRDTVERLSAVPDELRSRLVFIHLNHTNPLLDPDSDASRWIADQGFSVAREGDVFEL